MPRINHNIPAMVTGVALGKSNRDMAKSLEKLSTGLRINRAADDAAGLGVSESLRTQVRGLAVSKRNAMDGVSLLNIAEGALNEVSSMLQRMRELSVQAANDTLTTTEREYLNGEFDHLRDEITRIVNSTQFNGQSLLTGTEFGAGTGSILHIGPNNVAANDELAVIIDTVTTGTAGLNITTNVLSGDQTNATAAISSIDFAIDRVNTVRSNIGAYVNRLEYAILNIDNQHHNTTAAESTIRDTDFASETTEFTKNQILTQSSTSMLAQANMLPQGVLSLLNG